MSQSFTVINNRQENAVMLMVPAGVSILSFDCEKLSRLRGAFSPYSPAFAVDLVDWLLFTFNN